ncbi:MAG TPA: hypothetical protein VF407_08385, partial [Polyangiaceae bacterium]
PSLDVPDLDLSAVQKPAPPPLRKNSGQMAAPALPKMDVEDALAEDYGEAQFELDVPDPPPSLKPAPTSVPSLEPPPPSNVPSSGPSSGSSSGSRRTTSGAMPAPNVPTTSHQGPRELTVSDVPVAPGQNAEGGAMNVSAPPPSSASSKIDPHEAADLAAFGPAPTSPVQLPLYAFRVRMRQSELRRDLERSEHALAQAQKDHGAALADDTRLEEVKKRLRVELASKEREVERHRAAIAAFDPIALKKGTQIGVAAVVTAVLVLFSPVLFRACVGVDPPNLSQTPDAPKH